MNYAKRLRVFQMKRRWIAEGVGITARTVRELRAMATFPPGHERLRIITPREWYRPESMVQIEVPE
jgi:hypothetical protein